MLPAWATMTMMAQMMYSTAMKGTSFSVTWPMRFTPPMTTMATKRATMIPVISAMVLAESAAAGLKATATWLTEVAMELI